MAKGAEEEALSASGEAGPPTTERRRKNRRRKARPEGRGTGKGRRGRGSSTPFPPVTFPTALPLAEAIQLHGAGQPIRRLTLFEKLEKSPESSVSRYMIINAGRYGLITGGYQAEFLELTSTAKTATSPDASAREKLAARFKLAIEHVPAFKFLYDRNKGQRLPSPEVLRDSLSEAGIDDEHRRECVEVFLENLKSVGGLRTIAGAERVVSLEQVLEETPASSGGRPANRHSSGSAPAPSEPPESRSRHDWETTCFVIAPIGDDGTEQRKHSDMMLEALISRALEGTSWNVVRADQISKPGMISGQVIDYLIKSGLVVADLSFHNPNVFYELALRHVVGRPTVHIIRKGDTIPFDLKDFRTITIDTQDKYDLVAKLDTYRAEIGNYVREAVADVSESANPIRVFGKGLVVSLPQPSNSA